MTISLQQLRIASLCTAAWDDMVGDDRSRFCEQCKLNVYNFASMTQREIEQLILHKEGRLCARLYQRRDGTVLVRDCPVGLAAIRRRAAWMVGKVAAGLMLAAGGFAWAVDFANPHRARAALDSSQPLATMARWLREPEPMRVIMGDLAVSPVPPGVYPLPPAAPD
jgi:hypothetical protein